MDKRTMKAFGCLTPVEELTAEQIRLREKASQAVFARYRYNGAAAHKDTASKPPQFI